MTPEASRLLLDSVRRLEPHADRMATVFFDRLFALAPECRPLFATIPLDAQFRSFVRGLAELVAMLEEPDRLVSVAAELGRRHAALGVTDAHYHAAEDALSAVLDRAPAELSQPELRAAWREAYELASTIMRRAAARPLRKSTPPAGWPSASGSQPERSDAGTGAGPT